MIACYCPVCLSTDPRDKRTRSSIFLQGPQTALLVDTSPDLRFQSLQNQLTRIDAVLFTHRHADHIMGFDDLRRFCDVKAGPLPIYGPQETLDHLQAIFDYAFNPNPAWPGYVHVIPHAVEKTFFIGEWTITPLPLPHGRFETFGYLFEAGGQKLLAYLNDCQAVPPHVIEKVQGVNTLLIDGLRDEPHPTHLSIPEAIAVAGKMNPRQTYLTHLTHQKTHAARLAELPPGICVAHDGLRLEL